MKAMCRAIHAMGLKAGIYSTPWMGTYAGFIGGSAPDKKADYAGLSIPEKDRLQENQIFGRYPGVHRRHADRTGPVWLFDRDARQWHHQTIQNRMPKPKRALSGPKQGRQRASSRRAGPGFSP